MKEKDRKVKSFIKQKIKLLTATNYDKSLIKEAKREFFIEKLKNDFGIPTNSELAESLVMYLVRIGKLSSLEEVKKFRGETPFLNDYLRNLEAIENHFKKDQLKSVLSTEDLKEINRKDFIRRKEDELKEKVIEEQSKEIDKAIQEKIKEYESLPSILEKEEIEEPELEEQTEEENVEWWKSLRLREDPFPRQEGLDKIPEEIYDKVIYKNDLIKSYVNKVYSNRDYVLNKGILVLGDFGTGKTTFFDYLDVHLYKNKIYSCRIVLPIRANVVSYRAEFLTRLFEKLKEGYYRVTQERYNASPSASACKKLMKKMQEKGWSFVIILDDLHKHVGYENVVLDFLASLQIDKDEFIRSGIDIGFFVAGHPSWEDKLKSQGALSGFFDSTPEEIPTPNPKDAYEVIDKRLKAYRINPRPDSIIKYSWVESVCHRLEEEGRILNYRLIIDTVIKELRNKNFDILQVKFAHLDDQLLKDLTSTLKENSHYRGLEKVIHSKEIKHFQTRTNIVETVIQLYLNKGIRENDPEFNVQKFALKKLEEANLIVKQETADDLFKWALNPDLYSLFQSIEEDHHLRPEDYLEKALNIVPETTPKPDREEETLQQVENYLSKLREKIEGESIKKLIDHASEQFQSLESFYSGPLDSKEYAKRRNEMISCLVSLSRIVFISHGMSSTPAADQQLLEYWTDYWYIPDTIPNFIQEVYYDESGASREKLGVVSLYFEETIQEITQKELEILENPIQINLPYRFLSREEAAKLNEVRKRFNDYSLGESYFNLVKDLNVFVEKKLRKSIFNQLNLIYGNIRNRLDLYGPLKKELEAKGIEYDNFFFNEFQNINRGEYKQLILHNKKLRKQYFKKILFTSKVDIESFLDIFCDTNIAISHLKTREISQSDQSLVYRFILEGVGVVRELNDVYNNLIRESFYYCYNEEEDDIQCYFSLAGLKDETDGPHRIEIPAEIANSKDLQQISFNMQELTSLYKKIEQFSKQGSYLINLEDSELIFNTFSINYRKFFAIISLLVTLTEQKENFEYGLKIKKHFGPEVKLILQE